MAGIDIPRTSSLNVDIYKMSDFPTPVGGLITLEKNKQYTIQEQIPVTLSRIFIQDLSSTIIKGSAFNLSSLTYGGTGTFFTGDNIGLSSFIDMNIISTSSGTLFDATNLEEGLHPFSISRTILSGWTDIGNVDNMDFVFNLSALIDVNAGFKLTNPTLINVDDSVCLNMSDLGVTFFTVNGTNIINGSFDSTRFVMASSESAIKIDSSINIISNVSITSCTFDGTGNALDPTGVDQKNNRVVANANIGILAIPDSMTIGSMVSQGNTVETVISAVGEGDSNYVDFDLGAGSGSITAYATNGAGGTTVTSAAHGQPNEKLVLIAGSTSYNGQHELFNVTTNTYDIDVVFVANDATGTWNTGALAGFDIEGFEVVDAAKGIIKQTSTRDFSGNYSASISSMAVGGAARRYKFRLVKSTDGGTSYQDGFAIPDEIKNTISNTSFQRGMTSKFDDLHKMQVANFDNTANITIDTLSVGII